MVLPDPQRSRVVLIGASRFADAELPDLPAVRNNLEALAACLRGAGRCTVVADPGSPLELIDAVHDAAAEAEDTLVVYYAGHGLVHPRTLGLLLAVTGSVPARTHTSVSYDQVREYVIDSPARRKVVILDCCYSGRAMGGMADPSSAVADEAAVEGTYVLASAPPNKQALSPPGETYTAFTSALLGVLTEGLPDGPEHLHLDLIYRHVRNSLRRAARPEPQLRTDNTAGELALVRNPAYPLPSVPATPEVRERVKELVRAAGIANRFVCPVCDATVSGHKFVSHVDKHSAAELAALDPATLTLTIRNTLLANKYLLGLRVKGSAHVFRAFDTVTKADVLMSEHGSPIRPWFSHPVIVSPIAVADSYTALENVDGRTVADLLRSHGPLAPDLAVKITAEVCAALDYLHGRGTDHGDVNGGNVLLTKDNKVKLITLWHDGAVDPKADVDAAGRLLAELLTGESPVLYLLSTGLGWLPNLEIPPALDTVVRTASTTGYPSAAALRSALLNAL